MAEAAFYRHSGRFTAHGLLLGALAAFLGGPLLGALYAVAIYYIPFIYLNVILTLLFGAAMGFGVGYALRQGHVRNTPITLALAFAGAAVAHYVGWIVWVALVFSDAPGGDLLGLLFPPILFEAVGIIGEEGAWSFRGTPVSGAFLWVIWVVEALLVFGAALFGAFSTSAGSAYCEGCQRWLASQEGVLRLTADTDSDRLGERLARRELGAISELSSAPPEATEWHAVDLEVCDGCGGTNTLQVMRVSVTHDAKGNEKRSEKTLLDRLLVTRDEVQWVQGYSAQLANAAALGATSQPSTPVG